MNEVQNESLGEIVRNLERVQARMREACLRALRNRDQGNIGLDETPSHGWIHKMLICARLRRPDLLANLMRRFFATDVFYATGLTDHNTDRSRAVFCTDTLLGLQGVVQEMLVFSDDRSLCLLPALIPEWKKGRVTGLRARSRVLIEELSWDLDTGEIALTFLPRETRRLRIETALWDAVPLEEEYRANQTYTIRLARP